MVHRTASLCSRCGAPFAEAELSLAKDGSGLVCDACAIRADMPDVRALLRRDDRKKGLALLAFGVVALGVGGYLAVALIELASVESDLGLGGGVRPGPAILFLMIGGAAAFYGARLVWQSRK